MNVTGPDGVVQGHLGTIHAPVNCTAGVVRPGNYEVAGGDWGTLTVDAINIAGTGVLDINIGTGFSSTIDTLRVTGAASLGGTLRLSVVSNTLSLGDQFQIITAGSISGTFDSIRGQVLSGGRFLRVDYGPTAVTLTVTRPKAPGGGSAE